MIRSVGLGAPTRIGSAQLRGYDPKGPVKEVVSSGLRAANTAGVGSVNVPTTRMGVMRGAVERTPAVTIHGIASGIKAFVDKADPKTKLREINVVVYGDEKTAGSFRAELMRMGLAGATK